MRYKARIIIIKPEWLEERPLDPDGEIVKHPDEELFSTEVDFDNELVQFVAQSVIKDYTRRGYASNYYYGNNKKPDLKWDFVIPSVVAFVVTILFNLLTGM